MLCVYRKLVIGFMVINSISSWFKKSSLYILDILDTETFSDTCTSTTRTGLRQNCETEGHVIIFFSFQQKVLHICYQAKALVQKHWHKEKNHFPKGTHPVVQVVMFSEWYEKMHMTLTQHICVCLMCGAPYRPSLVLLQCLLLGLYLFYCQFSF